MSPDLIVIDEMIAEVQKSIDADSQPKKKKVRKHARPKPIPEQLYPEAEFSISAN